MSVANFPRCLMLIGLCLSALPCAGASDQDIRVFLQQQCVRCHGAELAEHGLRLDQLGTDLSDNATRTAWHAVARRIRDGEMPPPSEEQPSAAQTKAILSELLAKFEASAHQRRALGRTVLRRLNRVEYENTVRELFNVEASVKDLLPEDAVAHGFDNIGSALNVSPVLIERYLDAADAVLTAAVAPVHQLDSQTQRYDLFDSLPKWFLAGAWRQDSGVILFRNSSESASDLRQFKAPAPGRYRFRVAATAHNSETPLPMAALVGNFVVSGNPVRHLGYFDVPPAPNTTDQLPVIEFEARLLAKNDTVKIAPVSLPFVYLKQETMPEYPGPGLHVHWIEVEGPLPEAWPTESYRRVYGEVDPKQGTLADADTLLRQFLPKAFRRPIEAGEVEPFVELVNQSLQNDLPFDTALRIGLKAVLTSPKFLYLREPAGKLDDYALASRLAYFLWSSLPDETLLDLAGQQKLHEPAVLHEQVERLLMDPKARAFTENFAGQWLSLREILATTPDKTLYPEYDELLQWSSLRETEAFFNELLRHDLSVTHFVDSDFAMLNGRLAKHYQIADVHGVAIRKVPIQPTDHRGGVLTQASILKVTANGTNTSPVLRGTWVLDRILGQTVPPPPPNVPAVEPDIRGASTIREQLAKHRATEACNGCHARIDPPGFALENYDVIGGWRERYRVVAERKQWVNNRVGPLAKYLAAYQYGEGPQIISGDRLPDGREFTDINQFKKLLLANPERIARTVASKLVTYATGQSVSMDDEAAIKRIIQQTEPGGYGLRSLVHAVVGSDLFLWK
ncbi:MAG: DUF1592 domain-containing protein [Pirellulaceae bacterium]|nr:DUF1592 domain-containing protein [Pirellulaceae bacterium]